MEIGFFKCFSKCENNICQQIIQSFPRKTELDEVAFHVKRNKGQYPFLLIGLLRFKILQN